MKKHILQCARVLTTSLVFFTLGATTMFAQAFSVSGTVKSNAGPEPGVIVFETGNQNNAAITDVDGAYSIKVSSSKATLTFSLVGFKQTDVAVAGRKTVDVLLEEDAELLEEVVVVGYGAQNKDLIVGSVSQVTAKDIMKAPVTNVSGLLAGRVSGVTSRQTSGVPGEDQASLLVRGLSTFNSSSPLVIVDGVERSMNYLNPNDIATISILKDAATAAIYGVRGGNGVILVTTKTGAQGSARICYDGSVSFDTNVAVPEFCNAEQFVYYHNKARELDGLPPLWTEENLAKLAKLGILGDTDWMKTIYKPFGFTHQHNLSASGGNERVRYYTSVGLMNQDGILLGTDFQRFNVRTNIDAKLAEGLNFNINIAANHGENNKPGYNIAPVAEFSPITAAYFAIPLLTPNTPDGVPVTYKGGTYYRYPVASCLDSGYQNTRTWNFEGSAKLQYDFDALVPALKGLNVSLYGAYNFSFTQNRNYMTPFTCLYFQASDILAAGDLNLTESHAMGISERNINKSASYGWNWTLRPAIEYSRTFGKNSISAMAFYESHMAYSDTMTAYSKGFYSDDNIDISYGMNRTSTAPSGSYKYYASYKSVATRLNYAWDGKYMAEFTLRADGTYKFAPDYRWGVFPSIALGWVMSKEKFMSGTSQWLDFFKLRASYGQLGADDTGEWLYMKLSAATANAYNIGGSAQTAFYSKGYVHPDLTWSHMHTWNVGFESRMFNNKLTAELDVFYKFTDRILEQDSTGTYAPSLGGYYPTWLNSGQTDNRGFELSLRHDNWLPCGLTYSVTGMVSWARNTVISKRIIDDHPSYRQILGQPMGTIYGFHALGLFQTQEEIDAYPTAPSGYVELGAIKYEDVNGDGIISSSYDYVKIGRSMIPEMTFSFGTEIGWKGLHLSLLFQGAALSNYCLSGGYNGTTDNTMFTRAFYGNGNSVLYLVKDAWTPDNTGAKYPRLTSVTNANNAWASDMWVVNGAYLRLKNAQLTYTLPKSWMQKAKMNEVKVFVAGTNLLTLCEFKYLDPENPGINNGYYPQQKTASIGLNVTF